LEKIKTSSNPTKPRRDASRHPTKEGMYLRKLRIESKMSLRSLAEKINRSCSWLLHLEVGRFDAKDRDYERVCDRFAV